MGEQEGMRERMRERMERKRERETDSESGSSCHTAFRSAPRLVDDRFSPIFQHEGSALAPLVSAATTVDRV